MKILLVDDHVLFREGIALLLRSLVANDSLYQAGTCEEALALVAQDPSIELVLMDINLPGTSGINAISLIRAEFPLIPVVGLSSSDDKQTILDAIDAGAMGFIPKSSSSAVLFAALQLVLSKGIYIPPEAFLRDRGVPARTTAAISPDKSASAEHATPRDLGLTPRQSDVLFLILQGKSAKAICRDLSLSSSTVKVHTSAALRALNVTTRTQAVIAAGRMGLRFDDCVHPRVHSDETA
ncbi:MAG TPA: response regulator transcription factor [Steroidobacteraceae bacterium]|nr:response regulator transcription factor [Steroidobacteraceae bacterium]